MGCQVSDMCACLTLRPDFTDNQETTMSARAAIESVLVENRVSPQRQHGQERPHFGHGRLQRPVRSGRRTLRVSGPPGPRQRGLVQALHEPWMSPRHRSTSGLMTANSMPAPTAWTSTSARPRKTRSAVIFEADDGTVTKTTYKELLARVSQFANAPQGPGHPEGRPRAGVHAHDARRRGSPCRPVPASAPSTAWCSAAFGQGRARTHHRWWCCGGHHGQLPDAWWQGTAAQAIVDEALDMGGCDAVKRAGVQRTASACNMVAGRDLTFDQALAKVKAPPARLCPWVRSTPVHPYTSGSTGKAKGCAASTGGYLLWAKLTMDWTFDLKGTVMCSGAPPTLAGSPATATWLMARWRQAPPRSSLKASPPTRTPGALADD